MSRARNLSDYASTDVTSAEFDKLDGDNSNSIESTKAPIDSPTFTGTVTASLMKITPQVQPETVGAAGTMYMDSSNYHIYVSDGTSWRTYSTSTIASGGDVHDVVIDGVEYRVHTFTSSGTFNVSGGSTLYDVEYIVVGGGGYSHSNAGAGAGGYRSSVVGELSGRGAPAESTLTLLPGSYSVIVGAKGTTAAANGDGNQSSFNGIVSLGGGGNYNTTNGRNGGSGGGARITTGIYSSVGGSGTSGQGYDGGSISLPPNISNFVYFIGSGSGGAASSATDITDYSEGSNAGDGIQSNITGFPTYYCHGGNGQTLVRDSTNTNTIYLVNGQIGLGVTNNSLPAYGGGGGTYYRFGADGIVIIRYKI